MYAERIPPGTPPCESCRVELVSENEDAAAVYMMCRYQITSAPVGDGKMAVDISIPSVESAMRIRGVKGHDQWDCLGKVRRLFHEMRGKE